MDKLLRAQVRKEDGSIPEFTWQDWSVFGVVLGISVAIGIFFGCVGKKNKSNEEYLLGGRNMNPVPVALSLLCR